MRQDLEENLFDNSSKCQDCECDSALYARENYVNQRSKNVFDKSTDEEISGKSCDEYAVRAKQEKLSGKSRAEIYNNKQIIWLSSNIFEFMINSIF